MKKYLFAILTFTCSISNAQVRIDSSFPFQTDPSKNYSLYIPSGYNASVPHRLMLALHPLNVTTWNSISWCDTLTNFAEANNLILVCPDGGIDGMIDDPIDTAFTSALLDSMLLWYNIDTQKIYAVGFSWGGKTTYTYGLFHSWRFGGFIPIGAAVNGTTEVTGIIQNANGKPFYLVHGGSDIPATRFYPIRTSLISNGAIEKDTLMPGIGHTINFPNRNLILSAAYQWIDSVNCAQITSSINNIDVRNDIIIFPNPTNTEVQVNLTSKNNFEVEIINEHGEPIIKKQNIVKIDVSQLPCGIYFVKVSDKQNSWMGKFIKQ